MNVMVVVFTKTDSVKCKFIDFEGVQIKLTTWDDEVLFFDVSEISYIKLS